MMSDQKVLWVLEDHPDEMEIYQEVLEPFFRLQVFMDLETFQKALLSRDRDPDLLLADMRICKHQMMEDSFPSFIEREGLVGEFTFPVWLISSDFSGRVMEAFHRYPFVINFTYKPFSMKDLMSRLICFFKITDEEGRKISRPSLKLVKQFHSSGY